MNSITQSILLLLYQNTFTYRYSNWIQRTEVENCVWNFSCPDYNEDNLCNRQNDAYNMGKSFSIESPYAALLIQETCFNDSNRNLRYEPEFELNMISSTLEAQSSDMLKIMPASGIVVKCYLQNENLYNSYIIKWIVKYLLGMIMFVY